MMEKSRGKIKREDWEVKLNEGWGKKQWKK